MGTGAGLRHGVELQAGAHISCGRAYTTAVQLFATPFIWQVWPQVVHFCNPKIGSRAASSILALIFLGEAAYSRVFGPLPPVM